MRRARLAFLIVLTLLVASCTLQQATASSLIPKRIFYLTGSGVTPLASGTLSTAFNACSGVCLSNLTISPVSFMLSPALQSQATVNGPVILSFWINGTFKSTTQVSIQGAFSYNFPGQTGWINTNYTQRIFPGLTNVNVTIPISTIGLVQTSAIAIEISATGLLPNSTAALRWGSSATPSLILVPMSGYQMLSPANTVMIVDRNDNPVSIFHLDVGSPNNLVVVKVNIQSALGASDIRAVNMTIEDPNFRDVKGATNQTMKFALATTNAYEYLGSWPYAGNSTQGTYQIFISIIDSQGNVAYSSPPGANFGLVPPGYIAFPYDLIPYFIVGGVIAVGVGGGFALYRKRRKSYLVPFEHFNTLTGGGLSGGTVITVEGNTGSGKTLLMEQLMGDDLRNARPCVFVSTGDFPTNIRGNMKAMGIDVSGYEQSGLLTFVDGYSSEAGQESHEKVSIPSLGDLTTLGIKITSVLPSSTFKGGSLYFDSLTPLASKAKPESIVSFVQSVGAKVKGLSGKAFFTIGLGIDQAVQRQLEDTADCIVQMEAFEESGSRRRRLRIAKFRAHKHQEGWALFTIEDGKGIIFYSKRPKQ